MANAGRAGDKANCESDGHDCPDCPHTVSGPAVEGSPNVFVNGRSALRVGDAGDHSSCCGANAWVAQGGAPSVFINERKAHRQGDATKHCGGLGQLIDGSDNVIIGDYSGADATAKPIFRGGFFLRNGESGQPMTNIKYRIITRSGAVFEGRTDSQGRTAFVATDDEEILELQLVRPSVFEAEIDIK